MLLKEDSELTQLTLVPVFSLRCLFRLLSLFTVMTLSFYLFLVCALTCWSQYSSAYHATSADTLTVGFALTVDHATATIRHNSTFFEDLAKVEASEEYIKLMQRFSLWSSQHPRCVLLSIYMLKTKS